MPRIDLSERSGTASRIGRWATTAAVVVATLLALGAKDARAEVFLGIHDFTTLAELREMFPNAKIEELKPGWLQPYEAFYEVRGSGIPGIIRVKFLDGDLPSTPPEESLTAYWVLWVPEAPIPLERFVARYGPPDEAGYEGSVRPYRQWTKAGVKASLSYDEASVEKVDFTFTEEEGLDGLKITMERWKKYDAPPANPKN